MITKIIINKNRGWRGLAEVQCRNEENNNELQMIFSFSQPVWDDMLEGRIVLQDDKNYLVVHFDNTDSLPRGQRSVLLKNFVGNVKEILKVRKNDWLSAELGSLDHNAIAHFIKNRNNHTTSDWNCIGIRVVPMI